MRTRAHCLHVATDDYGGIVTADLFSDLTHASWRPTYLPSAPGVHLLCPPSYYRAQWYSLRHPDQHTPPMQHLTHVVHSKASKHIPLVRHHTHTCTHVTRSYILSLRHAATFSRVHAHKGSHIRAPHATPYTCTALVRHCQQMCPVSTANDLVDVRSLNMTHITSTLSDSQIGVVDRLHYYCVKEQHMLCQHAAWTFGLLNS